VTNVLVYEKDVTAMFGFIKGCHAGHVTGSNKKSLRLTPEE
jgi:hypothetical protein